MVTLTTTSILHDPVMKWPDPDYTRVWEEAEKRHQELSWRDCEKSHQEEREEDSEKESPLRVSECEYHWKLKTEEVKPPLHQRHAEYHLWACECEWHLVEQAKEEKWSRVCQEHPCHGFYGCDIKNCDKCNQSDLEEEEEVEGTTDICNPKHPKHGSMNWTFCRDDGCLMHKSEKDGAAYWPKRRKQKKRQSRHPARL